ncbi:ankyrin repeat domain-containing protein SOWAHD [Chiloscyllium plagiosum]|uniref:ankyrin repeat domain-containing protein SOWAHD n=1 Tax=Chiloscyllium plagiosum TaxID=36176 RepID=UPI001CB81F67|nr:ankyrin repeat domain-containing protein SOWAHD [Chiloscyllium plagiosum]
MFEKLGELSQSRFLGEASPTQFKPSPTSACSGSREGLSYSVVLEDVNRLSRLLGRFLKTAESAGGSAGVKPAETFPLRRRAEAAGGRGSLRKRESFGRKGGATGSEAGARRKGLRELMLRNGWDGFGGMWSAHSGGRSEQEEGASLSSSGSPGEALESREHEWALALAAGDWEVMEALLLQEPALLNRREFVSGLTAAHWLAKRGDHHGLMKLARLAQSRGWSLDLNARAAGGGYTALHLAAMQGHPMVIKLLVGAYDADVDVRDYRGRKAWQYLAGETPAQLRQLAGAQEQEEPQPPQQAPAPAPAPHRQHDSPTKNREFSLIPSVHRLLKLSSWQREKPEKADSR